MHVATFTDEAFAVQGTRMMACLFASTVRCGAPIEIPALDARVNLDGVTCLWDPICSVDVHARSGAEGIEEVSLEGTWTLLPTGGLRRRSGSCPDPH